MTKIAKSNGSARRADSVICSPPTNGARRDVSPVVLMASGRSTGLPFVRRKTADERVVNSDPRVWRAPFCSCEYVCSGEGAHERLANPWPRSIASANFSVPAGDTSAQRAGSQISMRRSAPVTTTERSKPAISRR